MKRWISLLFIVVCLLPAPALQASFYQPERPIVRTLHGMTLFLLPDHRLPVFHANLFIRGGSVYDPKGREGLSKMAMEALRAGGSRDHPSSELDHWIESVGGSMEFGSSSEYMTAGLSLLSKDWQQGLKLFLGLLRDPTVEPARFDVVKKRVLDAARREGENQLRFAMQEFPPLVYGHGPVRGPNSGSPWGRRERPDTLRKIGRQDVLDFHHRYFSPDRMVLAVSGDFDVDSLLQALDGATQDWPKAPGNLPESGLSEIPLLKKDFQGEFYLIPRKGLTQTTVVMGHFGEKRDNPDKYALLIMNFILGGSGSLVSRLGEEIRTASGKAYAVWSLFGFGRDYGLFQVVSQTATQNTAAVVAQMKEIVGKLATAPNIQDDELRRAKDSILRSFMFTYETKEALAIDLARFYLSGYPDNYLEEFQRRVAQVTRKDVERVARQYLNPDGFKVLLVGDRKMLKQFDKGMKFKVLSVD